MMLNMDPPGHSRLRRLLSRSFTPRAVAQLEHRIRRHARAICDRVFAGPRGECDFVRDVAADLPLLTLADVLGLPEQDRMLLFDWSNRVIGYQDPDYATSADSTRPRERP
jgi:cytochrome P450